MERTRGKYSGIVLWLLVIGTAWYGRNLHPWEGNRLINHDVVAYYAYLPAAFIYQDVYFDFVADLPADFEGRIWVQPTPAGHHVPKMTMGLAVLWAPFFTGAHLVALVSGQSATGYSTPYAMALFLAAVFYLFWGLWFLRRTLRRYLPDGVVALVLGTLLLATNLMHYVISEPGMSHVYSFFLFAAFLEVTDRWAGSFGWKQFAWLGLLAGLIVLVRPANILVLVIPLFWKVDSTKGMRNRLRLILERRQGLLLAALAAFLVWVPQLLYWKVVAGDWLYYTYGDEGFFFLHPHLLDGLFSWRKGWLIYTPVMILVFPGLWLLWKKNRGMAFPVGLYLVLQLYLVFSWWCWWYGGSFGSRPMIESYAFLALPLGYAVDRIRRRPAWLKVLAGVLLVFFISLNQFQMKQYRVSLLHWDSMSWPAYRAIFFSMQWPENYDELIAPPDYDAALRGEPEKGSGRE